MVTRNDGGSSGSKTKDRLAFFSFDLSSFTGTATSVKVDLEFLATSTTDYAFELWAIDEGGTNDEFFDESVLTFDNSNHTSTLLEANSEGSLDRSSGVTLVGSLDPTSYGTISFDSSDSSGSGLLSFINADTNNRATFVIYSTFTTGGSSAEFATKENTTNPAPTLTVIPEPGTLSLMAGGLVLALGFLRRRK